MVQVAGNAAAGTRHLSVERARSVVGVVVAYLVAALLAARDAIVAYCIGLYAISRQLYNGHKSPEGLHAEESDVAIVTGGATGIGFEVSRRLALLGADVIVAGPDEADGKAAVCRILAASSSARVRFLKLNLLSFDSVRRFVKEFDALGKPLHLLVNNAGVMMTPMISTKPIDDQLAVNYFGHFLLTRLLLPHLVRDGRPERHARVVGLSSIMHVDGDVQRVIDNRPRSSHSCYCDAKLAVVMATYRLDRLLRSQGLNVSATCVHPGVVATGLYRHLWWPLRIVQTGVFAPLFMWTAEQGASTVLHAAASVHTERAGGVYFDNCRPTVTCRQSYRVDLQDSLWISSCRLVGLDPAI